MTKFIPFPVSHCHPGAVNRQVVGVFKIIEDASYEKTFKTAPLARRKNRQTGLAPVGNAPLSPPMAVLPPEGEVCSTLPLVLT